MACSEAHVSNKVWFFVAHSQQSAMYRLALSPKLQIISQSLRDCSEDAGEVSSMYSTPNASSAFAILTLVSVSKNAFANCSSMVNI